MLKRIYSLILAITMVLSMIPIDIVHAEESQKLEVREVAKGIYMIREPNLDYAVAKQGIPKRAVKDEDLIEQDVSVGISPLLLKALGDVTEVKLLVRSRELELEGDSRFEHTFKKDPTAEEIANGVGKFKGKLRVKVPKPQYGRFIYIIFPDGRDSRAMVEANSLPTGLAVNINFRGHTGVETKWFGDETKRPDVNADYLSLDQEKNTFPLPKIDKNSILRKGSIWLWAGHELDQREYLDKEKTEKNPKYAYMELIDDSKIQISDEENASLLTVQINGKEQGQLAQSPYYFRKTGDGLTGFTLTMREKNTVTFNKGKGEWKNSAPAPQAAANGLKLSESFMDAPDTIGPVTIPDGATALTPPAAEAGQPGNEFKGWSDTEDGNVVDMDTYVVTGDTTFYAIYGPEAQGYAKVQFWDKTNDQEITDTNLRLDDAAKYANQISDTKDKVIDMAPFTTQEGYKAPRFVGYTYANPALEGTAGADQKFHYTDPATATLKLNYTALDDIVPGDKPQPDGYVKVTFHGDKADQAEKRGQLYKTDETALVDEIVYYVNPYKGIKLNDTKLVANIKAKDGYNVNTTQQWNDANNNLDSLDVPISDAQKSYDLYAQYTETTANKFKDKLKAEPIKVWKDEAITWKNGVALKTENADLKAILDADTTKVTDLGTGGTVDAPKIERTSANANLPDGTKGNLKVTFEDGSYVVVKDQVLYVAEHKYDKDKDKDKFTEENLPTDKLTVNFVIGEGVTGTGKTFYIEPNTSLEKATDLPAITAKADYKDAKWYKGDAEAQDADYTRIAESVTFTAKATQKGKGTAELKFVDTNNGDITLDEKTKIDGQKYTAAEIAVPNSTDKVDSRKDGADVFFTKDMAPQIRGYKLVADDQTAITKSADKYSETTPVTITLKYEKVADIVPAGPGVEKPAGYEDVTFANKEGAKLAGDTKKDAKLVYYVNPKAGTKVQLDGDAYQLIGKDKDNQDLKIPVPTVESADAAKYEVTYADGSNNKWAYDKFDQVNQDITKSVTFTAQVIKIGEPTVTYPDVEIEKGKTQEITPDAKDKHGETVPADKIGKVEVTEKPVGVTVTPADKGGKITVDVPKDYKGPSEFTIKVEVDLDGTPVTSEIKVKVKQPRTPGGGGGTIVIPSKPDPKPETDPSDLNKDDHYQYLIGYPDGTFAPNRGMTRAEVATMFTRLLKDRPVKGQSYTSNFTDVNAGDWYANTVGYAVQKGIVSGYPDGSFKPNQAITRAEFSAIAARFAGLTDEKDLTFTDLDASHWGYKSIRLAASHGWISGYPDNTFRPEQDITRAEVTSITNRMLNRYADLDWIDANMDKVIQFSDVARGDWFFEPIMEATMGHDFTRDADGKHEHWTGLNNESFI